MYNTISKKLIVIIVLCLSLVFSSCQTTPTSSTKKIDLESVIADENPYDLNTNTNLNNFNGILDIEESDIWEEKIIFEYENGSTTKIIIDASIFIANPDIYPVLKVEKSYFYEDDFERMLDYFFNNEEIYLYNGGFDVSLAEQEILILKNLKGTLNNYDELSEATIVVAEQVIDESIQYLTYMISENEIDSTIEPFVLDYVQIEDDSIVSNKEVLGAISYDGEDMSKMLYSYNDYIANRYVIHYQTDIFKNNYYGKPIKFEMGDEPRATDIDIYQALEIANQVLEDLGIENMTLASIDLRGGNKAMFDPRLEELIGNVIYDYDTSKQCFGLHFMRSPNGIPSAFGRDAARYMIAVNNDENSGGLDTDDEYIPPYEPEMISLFIDETGVVGMSMRSPTNEIEIENNNVTTITLDEAFDIFRKQMEFEYSYPIASDRVHTIYVDKLTKLMVRIPVKDSPDIYRYVPAYTFYGYSETENTAKNYDPISNNYGFILTINAIDGSIIDRSCEVFN